MWVFLHIIPIHSFRTGHSKKEVMGCRIDLIWR